MYMGIKHLHMGLALISILGFLARGGWLMATGHKPVNKFARILPHVADSLLLLTGLILLGWTSGALLSQPWLLIKLLFVALYIGIGIAAFRAGRVAWRWGLFLLALLMFAQTFSIARIKDAAGLLSLFGL